MSNQQHYFYHHQSSIIIITTIIITLNNFSPSSVTSPQQLQRCHARGWMGLDTDVHLGL